MNAHDLNLLAMGAGVGAYLAFAAALLFTVIDDFRIIRRDRAAAAQAAKD